MENKLEIFQEFLEFVRAPGAAMDETEFCEHAGLSEAELQGILDLVAKVEKPDSVFLPSKVIFFTNRDLNGLFLIFWKIFKTFSTCFLLRFLKPQNRGRQTAKKH